SAERVIARWEDSQNAVSLLRSSNLNSFRLAISSKRLDAQAEAAIFEFEKLEKRETPQVEIGRLKREAEEVEVARQINLKTFRP
ncbi:MAG: hypothetical protein WAK24_16735, partial [Candidatus Acidiferrales bacterium]